MNDGEDLLRFVERGLEPFGPLDKEKASYPENSMEMIQALQDRMEQLEHNLQRIWRFNGFLLRSNKRNGIFPKGILGIFYFTSRRSSILYLECYCKFVDILHKKMNK